MTDKETYELAMAFVRAGRERSGEVLLPKFMERKMSRAITWFKVQVRARIESDRRIEHVKLEKIERDELDGFYLHFTAVDLKIEPKFFLALFQEEENIKDMECPSTFTVLDCLFRNIRDNIIWGTELFTLKYVS